MAQTPEWALKKIRGAKEKRLTTLDLSGIGHGRDVQLAQIPDEVFELEHLEELRLRDNQLTAVPEAIGQLRNLAALDLNNNSIAALPDALLHLERLHVLFLGNNRLTALPK